MQVPFLSLPTGNPVFSGGLGLMVLGGAAAMLRSVPGKLWRLLQSKLYCSCVLENDDGLFFWSEIWLSQRKEMARSGQLRVVTRYKYDPVEDREWSVPYVSAGDGEHLVSYHGVKFWISKSTEKSEMARERQRTMRIRCLKKHRKVLEELLFEMGKQSAKVDPNVVRVYLPSADSWELHTTKPKRTPESLILAEGLWESLYGEAKKFQESRDWYLNLCIPYRFGMLLDGPPGNGKSTCSLALAGALERALYVLPLGNADMTDARLVTLMGDVPMRAVVVVEDIDTVFDGRELTADNKLTLSGVLNAIDGPTASEGRILILTTNRREVLDSALIRKGRCDLHATFENATPSQAERLFERFFPGSELAQSFATWAGDGSHSMAALQGHLLERLDDVERAARPATAVPEAV